METDPRASPSPADQPRSDSSRSWSARGRVTPSRSARSRSANRRCPGSRVPGCSSMAARRSSSRLANRCSENGPGSMASRNWPARGGGPLGREVGARLEAEARRRQRGGQDLHHQRELGALGVADRGHGAGHGRAGVGGRVAAGIECPARRYRRTRLGRDVDLAARHLAQAHVDDERRMTGAGAANPMGLVPNSPRRPPQGAMACGPLLTLMAT